MRDLLSKLDAIVSETELKNPEDLQAKRQALADLEKDPVASDDPEISSAITQRKSDLEKEAKAKGFAESFEVGDEFGISFSEDHEIATTIVDILEDGIVIELDDIALEMLTNEGLNFLDGELVEDKQKGVDGKACWKGYKRMGTKQKGGKTVDNCVKMEDHGPENPDSPVNYGEYDREGDMAKDDLRTIDDAAEELYSILRADDNLPEWVQSKITKAVDYIDTARDYMKAQNYEEGVAEGNMDGKVADIKGQIAELEAEQEENEFGSYAYDTVNGELQYLYAKLDKAEKGVAEAEKKGLYYYVNKRKKAGTSRDASHPKAPTAQAWKDAAKTAKKEDLELEQEFDMIEEVIEYIADQHAVDAELVWEDLSTLTDDELYVFAVTSEMVNEDWQKANKRDKTDGMSRKAVKAYRRENPGSKLKTAVTTKPSKLKKGGKASKRRKSYCSRSRGQMKMHSISCSKTPDKAICKARRRWNC